ncbi:MAG TPA: condensation domain-containing protein [Gemmatimonadaceae bacterium]|nr:condensation domain-containing protein [Gemmatimonadaceae bacterium]
MIADPSLELRRRVEALSDAQRRALAEALAREGHAHAPERLVGFVVPAGESPSDAELRAFLESRLPDYMVPARFFAVDRLPRTAAGKLDRRALATERGVELSAAPVASEPRGPRNDIEAKLAAIWRDVLKIDDVGIDDDFFELGGDSLLSIRVIGRAGREGIRISPERFFERPTIAHMAASVGNAVSRDAQPTDDPVGEAPLTPIQHWFVDAVPHDRDWWNQSYLLEAAHPLSEPQLREIVGALVRHHDALRLRLVSRDGQWRQVIAPSTNDVPLRVVRLDGVAPEQYGARVVEEGEREQSSLRLEEGRLFRCVSFEGAGGWQRILIVAHHVIVDGVSWNVLLEDFASLVAQAVAGQPLRLPERTASARGWAVELVARAATMPVANAASYWLSMSAEPTDIPHPNVNGDAASVVLALGPDESRALTQDVPRQLQASAQAVLLAAVGLAWRAWTGQPSLRLDVEGHGRDVLGDARDVSRTVGWFTTVFPFLIAASDSAESSADRAVRDVQSTLNAMPLRGAAHGMLRHLAPNGVTRAALAGQPRPGILFNYLGDHDVALPAASGLRVTDEPHGRMRSPNAPRAYVLEINARVERGVLLVAIEYSTQLHTAAAIERLAEHIRHALDSIVSSMSAPRTPVAFGVDASALATVADLLSELDDA